MCDLPNVPGAKIRARAFNSKVEDIWSAEMAAKYGVTVFDYVCPTDGGSLRAGEVKVGPGRIKMQPLCLSKLPGEQATEAGFSYDYEQVDTSVLKVDIHGEEWKVLTTEKVDSLTGNKHMLFEFHGIQHTEQHEEYAKALRKIHAAGYSLAFVNNKNNKKDTPRVKLGAVEIAETIQAVYVKRDTVEHTELDCKVEWDEPKGGGEVHIDITVSVSVSP